MRTLILLAVDSDGASDGGSGTQICEDAFELERKSTKSGGQQGSYNFLSIASILPPPVVHIDPIGFLQNVHKPSSISGSPVFIEKSDRKEASLQISDLREVLFFDQAIKRDGTITSSLGVGHACVGKTTHKQFMEREDFEERRKAIEVFLSEDPHSWYMYQEGYKYKPWGGGQGIEAKRLIYAILLMFNRACSNYAEENRIPTIKKTEVGLRFGVQGIAKFNSPLRSADGFINLSNLYAHLMGTSLPYTEAWLVKMGVQFKMV